MFSKASIGELPKELADRRWQARSPYRDCRSVFHVFKNRRCRACFTLVPTELDPLPTGLPAAHAMFLAERDARREAESRAHNAEAMVSGARLEIERLRLLLAKARRERFGPSSERSARLIEQLELQLAELEETAAEDEA